VLVATSHRQHRCRARHAHDNFASRSRDPRRFPDAEAVALASGATAILDNARVVATLEEALAGSILTVGLSGRPREFAGRVLALRDAAAESIAHAAHGDVALVFGTEMSGLSNDELARCAVIATIPANPDYASLNLAAAVQVVAYELRQAATDGAVWRAPRFEPASFDEIEELYAHGTQTLADMRSSIPGCRAACCRGCGGSSRVQGSKRKRSASCVEYSRASIRYCGDETRVRLRARRSSGTRRLRCLGARVRELWRECARSLLSGVRPGYARSPADLAHCAKRRTLPASMASREDLPMLLRPGFHARVPRRQTFHRPGAPVLVSSPRAVRRPELRSRIDGHPELDTAMHPTPPNPRKMRGRREAQSEACRGGFRRARQDSTSAWEICRNRLRPAEEADHRFNQLPRAEASSGSRRRDALRPYAMLVLLPAFAALLKIAYLGRRRRYPGRPRLYGEHLVFAAHNHAFLFVMAVLLATVPISLVRDLASIWIVVYFAWSMHAVYGGSWIGIGVRGFALLLVYSVLFAFVTVGLLVVAILLR
jgi:TrmH family RNA methyltransferase